MSRQNAAAVSLLSALVVATTSACASAPHSASSSPPVLGSRPYMGWSSWSLEGSETDYSKTWFNQQSIIAQSDALKAKLQNGLMLAIHSWFIVFPALLPPALVLAWRRRRGRSVAAPAATDQSQLRTSGP